MNPGAFFLRGCGAEWQLGHPLAEAAMRLIAISLIFIIIMMPATAPAAMYKHVDENGVVTYTDKPSAIQEEEFQPPEISNVESVRPPPPGTLIKRREPAAKGSSYKIKVSSPANDSTLRDPQGNVNLSFTMEPPLDLDAGHRLVVFMDGAKLVTIEQNTHSLSNMDRGTHKVRGEIQDQAGKTIARSNEATFHVKRQTK